MTSVQKKMTHQKATLSKQSPTAKNKVAWLIWLGMTLLLTAFMTMEILSDSPEDFSPGGLTSAHHQIELACSACHTETFGGLESIDQACQDCHNKQLNAQKDSHPAKKFTDPRNADRLEEINALSCVACHGEHHEDRDLGMAVTVANDFCIKCHAEVDEERPTHKGFDTMTCATAGCHNYHDNSALYEDFLMKHLDEPNVLLEPKVLAKNAHEWLPKPEKKTASTTMKKQDLVDVGNVDPMINHDWSETAHAKAGVGCQACHAVKTAENPEGKWQDKLGTAVCMTCHQQESEGFLEGKHGMREKLGLSAMTPGQARLAMNPLAHDKGLSCNSCHSSHRFDVQQAAVESCLNCHSDEHSKNYLNSKHYGLWLDEKSNESLKGTGVSCATCHMPRLMIEAHESQSGQMEVRVEHNQSLNLRPNEKMVRTVCLSCHGLQFTLDSLADEALILNNFSGQPSKQVESLEWAKKASGGDS